VEVREPACAALEALSQVSLQAASHPPTVASLAHAARAHPLLSEPSSDTLGLALRWACALFSSAQLCFSSSPATAGGGGGGAAPPLRTPLPHGLRWRVASAHPSDIRSLHGFVTELAIFEDGLKEVFTTPATFLRDGFGPAQGFHALLLEAPSAEWEALKRAAPGPGSTAFAGAAQGFTPVGMALVHRSYSTWQGNTIYLEDLYLQREARGMGAASVAFKLLSAAAIASGARRLQWCCLEWNERAKSVYGALRAQKLEEWRLWRFESEGLEEGGIGEVVAQ